MTTTHKSDREILAALYNTTGGPSWTDRSNWLEDKPLRDWHGIDADADDRVTGIHLHGNNLTGEIPSILAGLTELVWLNLANNDLRGAVPKELARLNRLKALLVSHNPNLGDTLPRELPRELRSLDLEHFYYDGTKLLVPEDKVYREWLRGIPYHYGTGMAGLSDREALEELYKATGGPNWRRSDNWLTDRPLDEWFGVDASPDGSVVRLHLGHNNLNGELPSELRNLTSMFSLVLTANRLRGRIPAELGDLKVLETLDLRSNGLEESIPRQLGGLRRLQVLTLYSNRLRGEIPRELGNLKRLSRLVLSLNKLTGRIPKSLGGLPQLKILALNNNSLGHEIPSALGNLRQLDRLNLSKNQLQQRVPTELGQLEKLTVLAVHGNKGLVNHLPSSLGNLPLRVLYYHDTALWEPAPFLEGFNAIKDRRGTGVSPFYIGDPPPARGEYRPRARG